MPGIRLFSSNRLEALVAELAEIVATPLRSPLHKEIIVVQSKGMERWLAMELAKRLGICANTWFPFPNALLDEMFTQVLGYAPVATLFDPAVMTWKVLRFFAECLDQPAFEPLRNYIRGDQQELKRFQLAQRIAHLFDQYQVYRPEMVRAWDRGDDQDHGWQPWLWRQLTQESASPHRADLHRLLVDRLRAGGPDLPQLPARLAVFGISALPPFHLEVLAALAGHLDVNLFLLNPCQEYWADIRSDREISRISDRVDTAAITPEALHFETGNRLLASMGALGRDFFHLVNEVVEESRELFVEPGEETLLACLQNDILHLVERGGSRGERAASGLTSQGNDRGEGGDRSIMIHSCHSPMREVEVLYDQLLALFDSDRALTPRDVLVMTPDINAYAPYIHAVFATPAEPRLKIPYSIADRSIRREGHISQALLGILELVGSRFEASRLLNLLETPPIRHRLALGDDDLEQIRTWVAATRIRWGLDQEHRERLGFGAFAENTWKAGFQRLLLGYAMPGYGQNTFAGILPYDHIEGRSTAVLGTFLQFCEDLFAAVSELDRPHTLVQWAQVLTALLDHFFDSSDDSEKELHSIRRVIGDLALQQHNSGFTEAVGVELIRADLAQKLDTEALGTGFITGGVTFCAMLPMRSIPCKVIALVGMNDGAFPRQNRSPGFDLMARSPRRGDRSPRDDDRYLFLEALLSARSSFYISYVGQSLQDNSPIPPSVLVSELLDVIEQGFDGPDQNILNQVVIGHRLHPFSPDYFRSRSGTPEAVRTGDVTGLFSYSQENLEASRILQAKRQPPSPFFTSMLEEPEDEWRVVNIEQLCRFFSHPVRFLLQHRLQLSLDGGEEVIEDRESFDLDHLQRYLVQESLLSRKLTDQDLNAALALERASGRLPHGQVGECRFQALSRDVTSFYLDIEPYVRTPMLPAFTIDLQLGDFRLLGRLDSLTESGLVRFRSATVKARDRLNLWVRHLALNAADAQHPPRNSILLGSDGRWEYSPVPDARILLIQLLKIYWTGLRQPLKFFPQLSYDYARAIQAGRPSETALIAARRRWEGSGSSDNEMRGEGEDPYLALCFAAQESLDQEFIQLAAAVFGPMLAHEHAAKG